MHAEKRELVPVAPLLHDSAVLHLEKSAASEAERIVPFENGPLSVLEQILEQLNELLEHTHVLGAYLAGSVAVDSRDETAQARLSELMRESVALRNLETRLTGWLGNLDLDAILERSEAARDHEYALRRAQLAARHLMSELEEELAAELDLSGATPWSKLHGDLTSQILVDVELDGEARELPMSEVRNLATNPDRETRRAAYEAELAAWEEHAVPIAAALNSIKAQVNTLSARRGWKSALGEALFSNNVDQETLDAMLGAVRDALPDLRRSSKTRLSNRNRLRMSTVTPKADWSAASRICSRSLSESAAASAAWRTIVSQKVLAVSASVIGVRCWTCVLGARLMLW